MNGRAWGLGRMCAFQERNEKQARQEIEIARPQKSDKHVKRERIKMSDTRHMQVGFMLLAL